MKHDESVAAFEATKQEVHCLVQDRIALNATLRKRGHDRECKNILNDEKEQLTTTT